MAYYSNRQLTRALDNIYELKRELEKKLKYAQSVLKSIAEAGPETAREQLIENAQSALSELSSGKEWK